jgi:hypothetical protein
VLDQLARQHERLQLLNDAAGQLLGSDDPDVIARDLFLRLEKHLGLHAYVNYVMSDDGSELVLRASGGIPEGHSVPRPAAGRGPVGPRGADAAAAPRRPPAGRRTTRRCAACASSASAPPSATRCCPRGA